MKIINGLTDVIKNMRALADSLEVVDENITNEEIVEDISLEEVRTVLAKKSQEGFTEKIREIIKSYGANKLSEIDVRYYGEIKRDAEVLGDE